MSPLTPELKLKIKALGKEVVMLHVKWVYYEQLFREPLNAVALRTAGAGAASVIENALFTDILLSLTRLVDFKEGPRRGGRPGKPRLTFTNVLEDITDPAIRTQIQDFAETIKARTADMRQWRDNKIAHNDAATHLAATPLLPEIKFAELGTAMAAAAGAMRLLHGHFLDEDTRYELSHFDHGTGIAAFVRYGLECWEEDKAAGNHDRMFKIRRLGKYAEPKTILGL